ncbi:MAG: adenylate/guanylate cyclase domain-containing protein [Armatimonadetes bacterium]|nr:adenylate/guanylate cyclase domain-containing protein [Armatimonadota bacterium]
MRGIQWGITLALLIAVLRSTPWTPDLFIFSVVEHYAYDLIHDWTPPDPPSDIVIVEIDDKSLRELGRFQSWHRDIYANLLFGPLSQARVVAFDVLFPEPDDAPVQVASSGSARHVSTADELFARAIREHGRVVLAAHWTPQPATESDDPALLERFCYPPARGALRRAKTGERFALPTPQLAREAAAVGYVQIDPDPDGVYRRFCAMMIGDGGRVFPHFGTAIAQVAAGTAPEDIIRQVGEDQYSVRGYGQGQFPIERDGATLIPYCGPTGTIGRVSLVDALRQEGMVEKFRDKIVLIGATAPGLYDIRPAPYRRGNRVFFGVETNANIANALLHEAPILDVSDSTLITGLAVVLGALVTLAVWLTGGESIAVLISTLIVAVLGVPSFYVAFRLANVWIPYGAILLAGAVPLVLGLYDRLTMERRLIQRQFDAYVSPDVLRELMKEPEVIRQSHRREVTLLFADVRGSTTLSESIPPEVWVAQLNEYLTQMSRAIFAFDGYLDKFMGDGIMACWNAFGTQEDDHAQLAVRAGKQMLARLDLLNRKWEREPDRTPLRIGIGIHSGQAVMGNVGSEERMQFTAIGDTVNTASRIEGLCKGYQVEFIISETTARLIASDEPVRELGEAEIRGREGKIRVFEVLRSRGGDNNDKEAVINATSRGQEEGEAEE